MNALVKEMHRLNREFYEQRGAVQAAWFIRRAEIVAVSLAAGLGDPLDLMLCERKILVVP